jgi:ATP-binding cassette subfamily F protein 3
MDIRSKDILKQALQAYDGTIIVVSHDRDFLNGLVDKVYEFIDGRVKEHLGGVDDFLRHKKAESFRDIEMKTSATTSRSSVIPSAAEGSRYSGFDSTRHSGLDPESRRPGSDPPRHARLDRASQTPDQVGGDAQYQKQKALAREEKRAKNRQNLLEKQIAELEAKMADIEKVLAAPTPEVDIMDLTRNYLELKRDLDAKMDEWASL